MPAPGFDLVSEGRRGDAVEFFMARVVGMPAEFVAQARTQPWWGATEALAHTLAYDATIMGDYSVPVDRAGSVKAPTLVMVGAAIGSIAQVPGIGGGFQAGYVFCMTTFFIVPPEQALATSLLAWVSSYVPTVLAGFLYMVSHGLSLKDLRAVPVE